MDNKETKKTKCLTINETKDLKSFGASELTSTCVILTFVLNDEAFLKCLEFKYIKDFILHFYISDTFDADIIVGVKRFEKCSIGEANEINKTIKITCYNKKYYNMSELKLLRKDKIGNLLSLDNKDDDAII